MKRVVPQSETLHDNPDAGIAIKKKNPDTGKLKHGNQFKNTKISEADDNGAVGSRASTLLSPVLLKRKRTDYT